MGLAWLVQDNYDFPPLSMASPDGLLAAGGDLSCGRLLRAYSQGIFPWFNQDDPILWWSPDPRMVLYTAEVKISKSLKRTLKQTPYQITFDQAFSDVMHACAMPRQDNPNLEDSTWIHPEMITAYNELHQQGHAHSVECWDGDKLVGGLYGIAIGRIFFGESMFSLARDSSKIALVTLCQHLSHWEMPLIDCQLHSNHLASMGANEIDRADFISDITQLCALPSTNSVWEVQPALCIAP
jgi:leucyl/phenylalanyl-tRNA--protein transferase